MKALLATIENRVQIPVLHTVRALDGQLIASDMDIETRFNSDQALENGLYNFKPLKQGIFSKSDIDPADFPEFNGFKVSIGTVKGVQLSDIEFILKAVSSEQTRYYLNGIAFDHVNMVATDGHRLHMIKGINSNLTGKPVIIPTKAIKLFIMACKESKATSFDIQFMDTKAQVKIGVYTITTRLIDGTFPDYNRVIPASHEYALPFKADSILDNYKKLMAMADGKARRVVLSGDKVTAKGDLGTYTCESGLIMPLDHEIHFNLTYLKESAMDSVMHYQDNGSPVMFTAGNRAAVLMPMRR